MNIPAEVREKAPQEELKNLDSYVDRVWNLLMKMQPGDILNIEKLTKPATRELFIETAKWYMREHQNTYQDGLSFTKGFVSIQKFDCSTTKESFRKSKTVTV